MKVLAGRLVNSSRLFLEAALTAYDSQEAHLFLLHAGTSLEHLAKARLAELNPALVAKRDHFPSLVWFADETKHGVPVPPELRTVTFDDAVGLLTLLGVPISPYKDHLALLQRY